MPSRRLVTSTGIVAALVLVAAGITLLPGAAPKAAAEGLVPYDSCGELLDYYRGELQKSATPWGIGGGGGEIAFAEGARTSMPAAAGVAGAAGAAGDDSAAAAVGSGPTGTNLQERGVDEPDLAKTSGELLLAVAQNKLQVVRRGAQPELLSSTSLGQEAYGAELLVDGGRVLVLAPNGGYWGDPSRRSGRCRTAGRAAARPHCSTTLPTRPRRGWSSS